MVIKKRDSKEQEVQDGWVGHVLPFELVQERFLPEDLADLRADEEKLSEISAACDEELEGMSEEDKDKDFVNDDKTAFVWPEVKKAIKAGDEEPYLLDVLKKVYNLNEDEKALKRQVKKKVEALHRKTKETIENLTDAQVRELLSAKWIEPLLHELLKLPESVIGELVSRLEKLSAKYRTTFDDVEGQISETEKELAGMIDDLTGGEFDMMGLAEIKRALEH